MGVLSKSCEDWAEEVAINLLGAPTDRTSKQLRWGRRGSLVVHIAGPRIGRFYNFETGEGGDLLDLIQWKLGIPLRDALAFMRDLEHVAPPQPLTQSVSRRTASPEQRWSARAQRIWDSTNSLAGTLGEAYLRTRCCHVPHVDDLRFLVGSRTHPPSLVARVTDLHTGEPMSLHFLRLDPGTQYKVGGLGRPNLADHAIAGGVVRLARVVDCRAALGFAEGIETALSVIADGKGPAWAALGTANLSKLEPLPGVRNISVWADNDRAGTKAAYAFADRWARAGHFVRILMPDEPGTDWNDVVRREEAGEV